MDQDFQKEYQIYNLEMIKLDEKELYNPYQYLQEHLTRILNQPCTIAIFYPGFID